MSFQDLQSGGKPSSAGVGVRSQSPSQAVAAGIFQINTAVAAFRRLVDAIGTAKDTPDHRQKLSVFLSPSPSPSLLFSSSNSLIWHLNLAAITRGSGYCNWSKILLPSSRPWAIPIGTSLSMYASFFLSLLDSP